MLAGQVVSERRLTGKPLGWHAQRLWAVACPRGPTAAPAAPRHEDVERAAPRANSLATRRLRSRLVVVVVMAAVPAPVDFPIGWAQEPDPPCGRRLSIRPQPTRAPCGEVVALGPSRAGDHTRVVVGGPSSGWGSGGMARDPAAVALRLSFALGVARGVSGTPPCLGTVVAAVRANGVHHLTREWQGGSMGQLGATPPPPHHPPTPLPPALAALRRATSFFCPWHKDHVVGAKGEGAGTPACPPHSPGTGGGTTASPCCGGGTARLPGCSPPAISE